ncbi:MAG: SCO family protein [Chloroflexales bacterium]|nr:SCO family protein [Chloroflexales bacterium]
MNIVRKQFVVMVCLLLCVFLNSCGSYQFKNSQFTPPDPAYDFELIDQNNQPFQLRSQRGKVVMIFFGYTNCPDVCPATLSDMQILRNRLGTLQDKVTMLFITVDPERDTVTRLKQFVDRFDSHIVALTGDVTALANVYKAYGAGAQRQELPESALKYAMDHTSTMTVIDKQGQRRLLIGFGSDLTDTQNDFLALIKE